MTRYAILTIVAFATLAGPAWSAGLPVPGLDAGPDGVTAPRISTRYVALAAGRGTLIAAIERPGGRINASRFTRERLVVPAVANDLSSTGLSADGGTLALARPRTTFPQRRSSFTLFDAVTLRRRGTIALRGDFTLDAISPDGSRLYLIQTKSLTRYAVRAYDVGAKRLLPDPIVDPAEADEPMRGYPLARAMSHDGRWAYTLYDDGHERFIHALDTARGEAKCIDLEGIEPVDGLRVTRDGTLLVRLGEEVVRRVDVSPADPPRRRTVEGKSAGWPGIVAGVALLAMLGFGAAKAGRLR